MTASSDHLNICLWCAVPCWLSSSRRCSRLPRALWPPASGWCSWPDDWGETTPSAACPSLPVVWRKKKSGEGKQTCKWLNEPLKKKNLDSNPMDDGWKRISKRHFMTRRKSELKAKTNPTESNKWSVGQKHWMSCLNNIVWNRVAFM